MMPPAVLHTAAVGAPPASQTLSQYAPLLVLLIAGVALGLVLVGLSWILGPKRPSASKLAPYECGVTPVGNARERFPVKFYLVAMLFIVFDIETVFLYPWAVIFRKPEVQTLATAHTGAMRSVIENVNASAPHDLQLFYLGEMIVFMIILFVGYIYVWKRGAFEWE